MDITLKTTQNFDIKRFRLRRTLIKPKNERTDTEISEAADVLQLNPFLSKFVENGALEQLIQLMSLEFFNQGQILFKQGDIGDKFYIIYDGLVGISIEGKGMVSELKKGDSFGELSLLFSQPRSGTAVVLESSEIITLSKDSYDIIIKKMHMTLSSDHFKFLRSIPLFSKLNKLSANYLSQISQLRKYSVLQHICNQGEMSGHIYLLFSGSAKLYKNVEFRVTNSDDTESRVRTPTYRDKSDYQNIFLEEVQQGFIIGAYEFFYRVPMQYTAICNMPCQVLIFDKYIFEKIEPQFIENFKLTLRPYESDRVIKQNHFYDVKWNIYKKKLFRNIQIEKALTRREYQKYRSPIRTPVKDLKFSNIKMPQLKSQRSKTQSKIRGSSKTPTFPQINIIN